MKQKCFYYTFFCVVLILYATLLFGAQKNIVLKVFPANFTVTSNGETIQKNKISSYKHRISLPTTEQTITISADGYYSKDIACKTSPTLLELKLEKKSSLLKKITTVKTGRHPKSVEFSPDGSFFAVALLEDYGIDIFDSKTYKKIKRLTVPQRYAEGKHFVETAYLPHKNEMWVSQMTKDAIHVFDLTKLSYKKTITSKGKWPKIVIFSNDNTTAFASNWTSNDISFIDTNTYKAFARVPVSGTPRGMVVSNDNKTLYVAIFGNGQIQKIDINSKKVVKTIRFPPGAKRHIAIDRKAERLYITDMRRGTVYVISTKDDSLIKEIKVDHKLNTCKLTKDKKHLLISSRGPNNPKSYLLKGPCFGKVYIVDTTTLTVKEWIWGGNQPTGLDISPNGKVVAFTNFLDNTVELYEINL